MSKVLSLAACGLAIDAIYINATRPKNEQRSLGKLGEETNLSAGTVGKIRSLLQKRGLVVIEGSRTKQSIMWNPKKSEPNATMAQDVYREYISTFKEPKVRRPKALKTVEHNLPDIITVDSMTITDAVKLLKEAGFTGTLTKTEVKDFVTTVSTITI